MTSIWDAPSEFSDGVPIDQERLAKLPHYQWNKAVPEFMEMYPPSPPTARDVWFREHGMPTDNERRAAELALDD